MFITVLIQKDYLQKIVFHSIEANTLTFGVRIQHDLS